MPIVFSGDNHSRLEYAVALNVFAFGEQGREAATAIAFAIQIDHGVHAGVFADSLASVDAALEVGGKVYEAVVFYSNGEQHAMYEAIKRVVDAAKEEQVQVPMLIQGDRAIVTLYAVDSQMLDEMTGYGQPIRAFLWQLNSNFPKTQAALLGFARLASDCEMPEADKMDLRHGLPVLPADNTFGRRSLAILTP